MARIFQVLFHVDRRIAEKAASFLTGQLHGIDQRRFGMHDTHAATAAAAGCLDDYRVTDGTGNPHDFLRIFRQCAVGTGHAGYAGRLHGILGRHLVAHQADGFGARADENEA